MFIGKKLLVGLILLTVAGWIGAAGGWIGATVAWQRTRSAESDAANWKRQAGKAYTELLAAKSSASGSKGILIAPGTQLACTMATKVVDGRTISDCVDGSVTLYPPKEY